MLLCRKLVCFYHLILAADCSTKYKTVLRLNLTCSILKLFTSTLDSQVFVASLSPWWIIWGVEGSPGRLQLHAELSCSCCRGAATRGYLGYHCLHVRCPKVLVHFNYPSIERGGYPEKKKKNMLASRLRFPIQLEVKTKELVRKMEFSPLNFCVAQNTGNLGESNKATTHRENIFMPPTAFQC